MLSFPAVNTCAVHREKKIERAKYGGLTPTIQVFRRHRQEDHEFEASLASQ